MAEALLLLVLIVAGCSVASSAGQGSPVSSPGASTRQVGRGVVTGGGWAGDVCGLLSVDEIQGSTGLGVAVGRNSAAGQRDCVWYSDRGAVTVTSLGGASAFEGPRAHYLTTAVGGVGDAAYWVGATSQLVIRSGLVVLSVNVDIADVKASYDDAVLLTALILPRL